MYVTACKFCNKMHSNSKKYSFKSKIDLLTKVVTISKSETYQSVYKLYNTIVLFTENVVVNS